jgi:sugar-specific transcriptional regulator TrmB
MENDLKRLGLSGREAKIYFELLKIGQIGAYSLSKKIGIERTVAYNTLNKLVEKGLVSYTKTRGLKEFKATNPENLLKSIQEKEKEAREIINRLKEVQITSPSKSSAEVYEGKEGLKILYRKILESKEKTVFVIGGTGKSIDLLQYESPHIAKELIKKKINVKILAESKSKAYSLEKSPYKYEVKYLPEEYDIKATTMIWDNYVSIHMLYEKPFIIIIENRDMAGSYRNLFKLLWRLK